jgi:hypothetical protein
MIDSARQAVERRAVGPRRLKESSAFLARLLIIHRASRPYSRTEDSEPSWLSALPTEAQAEQYAQTGTFERDPAGWTA